MTLDIRLFDDGLGYNIGLDQELRQCKGVGEVRQPIEEFILKLLPLGSGEVVSKVNQILVLFSGESVVVQSEQACRRVLQIEFQQQLAILQPCPVTPLFPQNIDKLEQSHEQTDRVPAICYLLVRVVLFHELPYVVLRGVLIDVDNPLDQLISLLIIPFQPKVLPNIIQRVRVIRVLLHEVEHLLDIIRVLNRLILLLQNLVLLTSLDPQHPLLLHKLEPLPDGEVVHVPGDEH